MSSGDEIMAWTWRSVAWSKLQLGGKLYKSGVLCAPCSHSEQKLKFTRKSRLYQYSLRATQNFYLNYINHALLINHRKSPLVSIQ